MQGLGFKWKGESMDSKGNEDPSWRTLIYTKSKFSHLFQVEVVVTNCLHWHWVNFTYKVIKIYNPNIVAKGGQENTNYRSKIALIYI